MKLGGLEAFEAMGEYGKAMGLRPSEQAIDTAAKEITVARGHIRFPGTPTRDRQIAENVLCANLWVRMVLSEVPYWEQGSKKAIERVAFAIYEQRKDAKLPDDQFGQWLTAERFMGMRGVYGFVRISPDLFSFEAR